MAINDITGDTLRSKWNGNFAPGWDAIWGKELKLPEKALNVADLKDRLSFLDQEAFAYDKATNEPLMYMAGLMAAVRAELKTCTLTLNWV